MFVMKKYILYGCLLGSLLGGGCNKMLEEDPKAILTPEFLKTEKGVKKGLDAAYAGTRYVWGSQDLFVYLSGGTDEFVKGVDGNTDLNSYTSNFTPGQGSGNQVWMQCYRWINACNGIIENAPLAEMPDADKAKSIGEAKFLRAMFYSVLVQFWRDVTVSTEYITTSVTSAKRNTLAESMALIIQDLKDAIAVLPAGPKSVGVLPGKANAAAARHLLGRMYLYRASTPAAVASDKEDAYQTLKALIDERNTIGVGLLPDFNDVFREGNEANAEVLFAVQHTSNYAFNGPNNSTIGDNIMNHMFIGQYDKRNTMIRSMEYGRPYIRVVPTFWVTDTVFKERVNDTRYGKTFQTVWFANSPNAGDYTKFVWPNTLPPGAPADAVPGGPRIKKKGDTSIYMPGVPVTAAQRAAAPYLLYGNKNWDNTLAPTVKKYFDNKRADLNDQSVRPLIVFRLAETYLLAAEAAIATSRPQEAADYINEIRRRAAYPSGNAAAMEITAVDATLDFLLDERTRELLGENTRWWDLVRTGTLIERVKKHNTEAAPNIQDRHVLRPIPQLQLDNTRGEKYNNSVYFPGWN
jgi:hypothetical protein